jgi:hypothetical protein
MAQRRVGAAWLLDHEKDSYYKISRAFVDAGVEACVFTFG